MASDSVVFTSEMEASLISLIQQYPVLYMIKSKKYVDRIRKENAWKEIANEMKLESSFLQNKWKNIRDYYSKIRKRKPTGSAREYKSKCEEHRLRSLSFLDGTYIVERKTLSNIQETESINVVETEEPSVEMLLPDNPSQHFQLSEDETAASYQESQEEEESFSEQGCSEEPPQKKKYSSKDKLIKLVEKNSRKRYQESQEEEESFSEQGCSEEIPQKRKNMSSKDKLMKLLEKNSSKRLDTLKQLLEQKRTPVQAFCDSLAATIEQFPARIIPEVKMKLFNIVSEYELKLAQDM